MDRRRPRLDASYPDFHPRARSEAVPCIFLLSEMQCTYPTNYTSSNSFAHSPLPLNIDLTAYGRSVTLPLIVLTGRASLRLWHSRLTGFNTRKS